MHNHYDILGVTQQATEGEIKSAYKKLALKYHPDKNLGNKVSEEQFKLINEAYQTLSNSHKRSRYDITLNYQKKASEIYSTTYAPPQEERSVYNRYGKQNWRNSPRYKTAAHYIIDKNYYRNISLSFITMLVLSIISVAISEYSSYLDEQSALALERQYSKALDEAQLKFDSKNYRGALKHIENLVRENPIEYRFYEKKEEFISELNKKAIHQYEQKAYASALSFFDVLEDYQKPVRMANWHLMAECHLALKQTKNAVRVYEFILERDQENLELILKIAEIYQDLGDKQRAIDYYNEARYTFKRFQEAAYGSAFEFIIKPEELPDTYYNMFKTRAALLFEQEQYEEVVKDCNWGIFMRPQKAELYYMRAKARQALHQSSRSCNDIKRAIARGFKKSDIKINVICDLL